MAKHDKMPQVWIAILAVATVAALCYPFVDWIGYRSVALILLLVVSILAMRLSLQAVLVAAVSSALAWDYFFIPPRFTLTIGSGEDLLLLIMYFIVVLLNGVINYRMRQFEQMKSQSEGRADALRLYNTLFSSLSHELRTPIAAIIGAVDTLQVNNTVLDEGQKKMLLNEISIGSLRLSEQVENLLSMSRLDAGVIQPHKEWCDVRDLVFGTVAKLDKESNGYKVDINIAEDFPLVQLDYGLTQQTLHNLLANAFRHTPMGTQINISARVVGDSVGHFEALSDLAEKIRSVRDTSDHRLMMEITDNGPGFSQAHIEHVFDKFYRDSTTKADGTGLGLYIVKGFTEAQGGSVSLTNRMNGGARFTLEYPTAILNQTIHYG